MNRYHVLIVDDDPTQHLLIGDFLREKGFRVSAGASGKDGLEIIAADRPDVILLDIQMPGLDGFQVLEKIRDKPDFQDIPILFLTSVDRQQLKVKGLELGADDYVTKPFNREELLARLYAALRRQERHRRVGGFMEGDLFDIGLSDLLQSMELGQKTASLYLNDLEGEIYIRDGMLIHARQHDFEGMDALKRLFLMEKGTFTIKFNQAPEGISGEPMPLMSVLMSVLADVDEIRDIVGRIRADKRKLEVREQTPDYPFLNDFIGQPPQTMISMLVQMEGELKENLESLIEASKKGLLKTFAMPDE